MADNAGLRVLHVNKFVYRRGGAEAYMLDTARHQRAIGHVVDFFGMTHDDNEVVTFGDDFAPELRLNPAPTGALDRADVAVNMIWNREASRSVERVIDRFAPDVVHLHNVYHQLSPSVLRSIANRGVPMVMTLHDYKLTCPSYNAVRDGGPCFDCSGGRHHHAIRNRCGGSLAESVVLATESTVHRAMNAYGPVDLFHCPSRFLMERMTDTGIDSSRLRHIPLPAEHVPELPTPITGAHAVYVGRLSVEKGPRVLIEAMAKCPGRNLVVVGDGPERAELESLAERVAPGRVTFAGRVPPGDVVTHIESARVVVVPSICSENQPLSVLEAHALGRPVVGSALGGVAELVSHESTGLLVPAGDHVSMAAAMERLFSNRALAAELGTGGWRRVRSEATVDVHLERLGELYVEAGAQTPSAMGLAHV